MKSPNGLREVIRSDYSEIRMGSPLFGQLTVRGGEAITGDLLYGEAMAFSVDSRYLAVSQLVVAPSITEPHTRVMVFDLDLGASTAVHDQNPGFIKSLGWSPDGTLTIHAWSRAAGDVIHSVAPDEY
jgi:hypothetical protein